jgi:Vanadium chloroperoxidase N-terminal domain
MRRKPKAVRALVASAALVTVVAVLLAGGQASAQTGQPENAVLDWNSHALNALVNASTAPIVGAGQTPPVSTLHLAMVQGAVYDAVNMIEGSHEPYLDDLPRAPNSASKAAAVATAAHDVLVGVVVVPPLSTEIVARLDGLRDESIAAATTTDGRRAVAAGIEAGKAAAEAMLEERENDGRYGTFTFTVGDEAGEWRPIPPANVNDPFAWVARVDPFLLESTSQFRTKGPHELTSGTYTKEYNEVKALGGNGTTTPSARTPEQLALAQFFVVNPIELFNRTFRTIAEGEGLTLAKEARLFAMLNLAAADALINCWDDKAHWSFWRPITAIRLGNDDGNEDTVGDPAWTPFVATPPYPDHSSGYNCATSAFMHSGKAFFGKDKMEFGLTATIGTPPVAVTRNYVRFTDVVRDTINVRVYQGLHFRAADAQGAGIGKRVAHWLDKNFFEKTEKR